MRDPDVILEENNALVEKLWMRMEEKDKEIAELLAQLNPGQPTFDALMTKIDKKSVERDTISAEWSAALRAGSDIVGRATGETLLRWQMASVYKAHKIGGDDRVNVVFCKFRQLAMRSPSNVMGRAFVSPRPLIWLFQLQWPYSFIVVDVVAAERRTVAHEIVHVAGEDHPLSIDVYEKLAKRIVSLKIPKGSLMGAPFSDVEFRYDTRRTTALPGGYFDGAPNDIMNYQLDDPTPDECILADSDRQLMNNAWFVG
jgi:hypothetical protein